MKKFILGFILGAILFTGVGVFAITMFARDVKYTPTNTSWKKEDGSDILNVYDALEDLYIKNSSGLFRTKYKIFEYKGSEELLEITKTGRYKLEVWGAQGGGKNVAASGDLGTGGLGGYASGEITLNKGDVLHINVGGVGEICASYKCIAKGGYNGGGYGSSFTGSANDSGAGGGGGWYGGTVSSWKGAGGGSGYVYTESTSSNYPNGCLLNSNYYLTNTRLIAGNSSIPRLGGGNEYGHSGYGIAKITMID